MTKICLINLMAFPLLFCLYLIFILSINSQPVQIVIAPTFSKMSGGVFWPSLLLRPSNDDNTNNVYGQNSPEIAEIATPRKRALMRLGKRALMRLGKK
ncbi:hypothetical protein Mgra_00000926 [Meloidogyne graminicola]|uniref:Uncharacterized protein n=1 Tax=Meloidogyne graminicola TaxID=189291 RepID=A0A8T0A0P2_9BILA|nr:hypothetical protein Mgra_00000926 [Meloidogyne graminicola]